MDNNSSRLEFIHPNDRMWNGNNQHYLSVGESFRRCMNVALHARSTNAPNSPIQRILDFGCGYGRITRVIREMFPAAEIFAADTTQEKGAWCQERFGAVPICNEIDLDKLVIPESLDLIWLGSVVTHLDAPYTARLIKILHQQLNKDGLLMISSHGQVFINRFEDELSRNSTMKTWGFEREIALRILAGTARCDYGYSDYEAPGYGFSIIKLEWWSRFANELEDVRMHLIEAAWDQLHDVIIFQRTSRRQGYRQDIWGETRIS